MDRHKIDQFILSCTKCTPCLTKWLHLFLCSLKTKGQGHSNGTWSYVYRTLTSPNCNPRRRGKRPFPTPIYLPVSPNLVLFSVQTLGKISEKRFLGLCPQDSDLDVWLKVQESVLIVKLHNDLVTNYLQIFWHLSSKTIQIQHS